MLSIEIKRLTVFFLKACIILLSLYSSWLIAEPEQITVTATRGEQTVKSLSNSLSVVGQDDLSMVSSVHISEALSRVPGVWINRGNGQEHLSAIRSPVFTGAGSCGAFFLAEDGIALRSVGFCNMNQLFDVNSEQAQRIEVLRGSGTVFHSSDALHGVINVISQAPAETPEGSLSIEGGPHDFARAKISISNQIKKHGFRLSANGANDGGYKEDSGFDQQKLSYRHDYDGATWKIRSLLSMANLNQKTAGYLEGEDAYKDSDLKDKNQSTLDGGVQPFRNSNATRMYVNMQRELAGGDLLILTPYLRYTDMTFFQHFLPGTPVEENGQQALGIQSLYQQNFKSLSLKYGIDGEFTDAFLKQTQNSATFKSQFSPTIFPSGKHYDYEVSAQMRAFFIDAEWQAVDALKISSGLRYEYLEYDYDNQMSDGAIMEDGADCPDCRYSRPADRKDSFEYWSMNAGLIYELDTSLSFVINTNSGHRAPQATELYRLQSGQTVTDLEPEELNNLELGFRGFYDSITYSITAYMMKKNRVLFQDSNRQNIGDGKTEHQGIEYDLNWQIIEVLSLNVSGSYAEHEYANDAFSSATARGSVIDSGNKIDSAPRKMHSLRLNWQYIPQAHVELEYLSVGEYYLDAVNGHKYGGHELLNLRFQHSVTPSVRVGVRVTNLSDKDYAERADFAFGSYRYFVGEPRAVYADISLTF